MSKTIVLAGLLCTVLAGACTGEVFGGSTATVGAGALPSSTGSGSGPGSGSSVGIAGGASTGAGATNAATGPGDIGFVTANRLNQTQYNNTVHDLLGTSLTPASAFPGDETDLDYNTIASALRLHPEHIEQYLAASQA